MDYMHEVIKKLEAEIAALEWGKTTEMRAAYRKAEAAITAKFKAELFKELGIESNPKRELLYEKAWSDGHSSGFREVWGHAQELVELIA